MQTIRAYNLQNVVEVQYLDPTIFTVRNRNVYTRPIKIYQGIDNPIQVMVLNQDQKHVNVTGYNVQLDIQDPDLRGSVLSAPVIMSNVALGQGTTTITKAMVNALTARTYKLTIKLIANTTNSEQPLYIDSNYSCRVDLEVLDGWYENMATSTTDVTVIDGGTI